MSRNMLLRLADSFFRRWFLYLLPFVLLVGAGVATAARSKSTFRAEGVMYVENQTLLANLTKARDAPTSYKSPSTLATDQLNSLKRTGGFMSRVIVGAKLEEEVKSGRISVGKLRNSVSVWSEGDNLVHIRASATEPKTSAVLVSSTIESFTQWVIDANVAESNAARVFLDDLVNSYKKDVQKARSALGVFVITNPEADFAKRTLPNQIEFQRLTDEVSTADNRLSEALNKREDARLATEQTKSDVTQRLHLVDPPEVPLVPEATKKKAALSTALFGVLGLLFSAGALLAGTMADRSVRFASDVAERLRVPVLSVLPNERAGR